MNPSNGQTRRWFYVREGRRLGPVETDKLVELVLTGEVSEDALVWHSGLPEWLKAREVEEIRRELPPGSGAASTTARGAGDARRSRRRVRGETNGDGVSRPVAEPANGGLADAPGEATASGRENENTATATRRRRPAWLWPLVVILVA
jgi:hypothetical protein